MPAMPMPYDSAQNPAHRWITQFQHVTGTVGLYTHADGNYSFIEVRDDSVYAAGITFTPTGIKLLEDYKAKWGSDSVKPQTVGDINQQLIEETYLMSQALYHSSWIKIADFDPAVEGVPPMYGWHFNWDGSKAVIVTHINHFHYGSGGVTVYIDRQESFVYEVTINEDFDGILTASLALLETTDAYILKGELMIWTPNNVGGEMSVNPVIGCDAFTSYDLVEFNAPLYGLYKPDGTVKLIRFFRTVQNVGVTLDDAVDAVDDINCPDRGWTTTGPDVIAATGVAATESCISGFKVDDTIISKRKSDNGGFYRDRTYSRQLNGLSDCGPQPGWGEPQISSWTDSNFIMDTSGINCAYSGCLFETNEAEIEYTEYMSTTGGPDLGTSSPKFALLICGRSTDSVAMIAYTSTQKTMRYEHRQEFGHDDVVQKERYVGYCPGPDVDYSCCGVDVSTTESFVMPEGSCGIQGSVTTKLGGGYISGDGTTTTSTETIEAYETDVWIANPYETRQTYQDVTDDYFKNGEYQPYLDPDLCNSVPYTNLWFDILAFSGRSVRKELEDNDVENIGSNCEIDVDLPGTTAFWLGAA